VGYSTAACLVTRGPFADTMRLLLTLLLAAMLALAGGMDPAPATYERTGRHELRAERAMAAWFNGATKNFVNCQRKAGVSVASIMLDITNWAAQEEPSQPPLDITPLKVSRFLDTQIGGKRVHLVRSARSKKDFVYQVVPEPAPASLPTDRHGNMVVMSRTKMNTLKKWLRGPYHPFLPGDI